MPTLLIGFTDFVSRRTCLLIDFRLSLENLKDKWAELIYVVKIQHEQTTAMFTSHNAAIQLLNMYNFKNVAYFLYQHNVMDNYRHL